MLTKEQQQQLSDWMENQFKTAERHVGCISDPEKRVSEGKRLLYPVIDKALKALRTGTLPFILLIFITSCTYVRHTVSAYSGQYSDSAAGRHYTTGKIQRYAW